MCTHIGMIRYTFHHKPYSSKQVFFFFLEHQGLYDLYLTVFAQVSAVPTLDKQVTTQMWLA